MILLAIATKMVLIIRTMKKTATTVIVEITKILSIIVIIIVLTFTIVVNMIATMVFTNLRI